MSRLEILYDGQTVLENDDITHIIVESTRGEITLLATFTPPEREIPGLTGTRLDV